MCDLVNHTRFRKEDHVPDYVGTNMVIRVILYTLLPSMELAHRQTAPNPMLFSSFYYNFE